MSNIDRWFVQLHGYDSIVETEGKEDDENFIADCGAGDLGQACANEIVACRNGCIGIEEPETTVPELVAMCCKLTEQFDEASQYKGEFLRKKHGDDDLLAEAGALLAKTGTRPT